MGVNDSVLNEVLDKTKKIVGIEEVNNTKTLIDVDDLSTNDIALKEVVMLIIWIIKDDYKHYP